MKYYNKMCQLLCKAIMAICMTLAVIMLCCSALQVFSRYILGSSITWTEECARYCFIWLDMLGAAILVYMGGHAAVDLISTKFRGIGKKIYQTALYIGMGYVGAIFAIFGLQLAQVTFRQTSPSLKLPMGIVYGVLPVCGVLICLFTVNRAINVWMRKEQTLSNPEQEGEH